MKITNKLYSPLILVLGYLSTTLLIYEFGFIDYYTPNKIIFYSYILYYMFCLTLGYLLVMGHVKINYENRSGSFFDFRMIVVFALVGSLIENMNIARTESLIPTNIINFVVSGFNIWTAAEQYYLTKQLSDTYNTNRLLNVSAILIAWSRLFLVAYIGYNIYSLKKLRILIGGVVAGIYPLGAISIGLNKPIMETALIFVFSVLVSIQINKNYIPKKSLIRLRFFLRFGIIFVLLAIAAFVNSMHSRGVTVQFLELTSPAGYISVNCNACGWEQTGLLTGLVWFTNYIVQGYHGFSLALLEPFDPTFGFGNSPFLLRQFKVFTGIDLSPLTFQEKTDDVWGAYSHWHSIYTHFANDVGFIGVGLVMFIIGAAFALTWKLAFLQKNLYAILLIPLYAFMFIFFPANNQVLGFVASLSAFLLAHILMLRVYQTGVNLYRSEREK